MRLFLSFLFFGTFFSCTNSATNTDKKDTTESSKPLYDSSEADIIELNKEDFYLWWVNADSKTITKNSALTELYLNVDTLLIGLNEMYPDVKLEKLSQGNDTLYTQIKNATYLTDQMGSAGSEGYIAQAVINLASVNGINLVKIDFEPGSHATPGIWSKQDFKDYKVVQQ